MKNLFFAASQLVIEMEDGDLKYNKGDFVDLRVTEDGTPFVVKHSVTTHTEAVGDSCILADGRHGKVKDVYGKRMCVVEGDLFNDYKAITEKVEVKIAAFEAREPFEALVKNLVMSSEFDVQTESQTISVTDLLVKEGLSVNMIARYIAETRDIDAESPSSLSEAVKSMTSITGTDTISVPVFRRIKKESLKSKIAAVQENLSYPKNADNVTESSVLAVAFDADNSVDVDGYMIATESMKTAVASYVSAPVFESVYKTTEGVDPESVEFDDDYVVKDSEGNDITEAAGEGATCYTSEGKIGKLAFVNGALVCTIEAQPRQGYTPGNGFPHPKGDYNDGDKVNTEDGED